MKKIKWITLILYVILAAVLLAGCGKQNGEQLNEGATDQTEAGLKEEQQYLILSHDTRNASMTMYGYDTGYEYFYSYSLDTSFMDKYGNYKSSMEFVPGKVVTISSMDDIGYLTCVRMSDQVWEYEKVRRFSIDEETGVFTIADTKYAIQENTCIFSDAAQIEFSAITENDILTVVGMDRKILSVMVTTGHGNLSLKNTELFEGSLMQLNSDIFAEVMEDMTLELPEGSYSLTVANDGWGSTSQIEIRRGETTEVDLDTLKGEGKKKGMISFEVDAENVKIYVDGKLIDHTQAAEITYGTHTLEIDAEGYEEWKKYLTVNSPEATLVISLTEDENSEEDSLEEDVSEEDIESKETEAEETESVDTENSEESGTEDAEALLEDALNELLESGLITGSGI